jgi:hypothetical protein
MIDLIKTLVEALAQAIPQFREMRVDKRKREIAAQLFLLYVRLNEAMLAADDIISSLEMYVYRMGRHLAHGDDAYALTAGRWVASKVQHQVTNLERIDQLLHDRKIILQILDSDSYNRLFPLLDHKFGALTYLLRVMREGSLPLSLSKEDWETLMDVGRDQSTLHHVMIDLHPGWRQGTVSTATEWGQETYERVVAYLQGRQPREQIAEMRAVLSSLREVLERNFSIADVLVEVGDKRLDGYGW